MKHRSSAKKMNERQERTRQETQQESQQEEPYAIDNRYDRQQRIEGWNQKKIKDARITIIGTDALAQHIAISSAALGFGTIEIYGEGIDTGEECGLFQIEPVKSTTTQSPGEVRPKVKCLEQLLKAINPEVHATGINIDASRNKEIIGETDIIIEATNDTESKAEIIHYAIEKNIPLISTSATETKANIGYLPLATRRTREVREASLTRRDNSVEREKLIANLLFTNMTRSTQGSIPSQVIAGIAVDEARKQFMLLPNERMLEDIICYNLSSTRRDTNEDDISATFTTSNAPERFKELQDYNVLMIGAGALGIMAGIQLAINGIGNITIVDFDTVETTNLNRQILYYDSVGRSKAESLAKKLKEINQHIRVRVHNEKITLESETLFKRGKYDAIIDGVDNNKTRALLNYFSLKYSIPLISGGTRYNGGQVTLSIPGINACLNCQADIDRLAQSDYRPASCIHAPTPSVITSNQIIGAMMAGEIRALLNPETYGKPITSTMKYAANEDLRIKLMPPARERCDCYSNEKKREEWPEKMRHLYDSSIKERERVRT